MPTRTQARSEPGEKRVSRGSRPSTNGGSPGPTPGSPAAELASRPGLRVRPYRPMRALVGALIVVASVVAALAVYTRVGNRAEVLAVNRLILAGEQITDADLHVVSISSDDSFPSIPAANRTTVVGQFARVRLAPGSLLVDDSIQPEQLVDPDLVLMSVVVPVGQVPVGLREQSRLALVVTPQQAGGQQPPPVLVEAIVAAVPRNLAEVVGSDESGRSMVALSVEVAPQWVALVGSASAVSVGVLDPQAPFPPSAATAPGAEGQAPSATASASVDGDSLYGATTLPTIATTLHTASTLTAAPPSAAPPTEAVG